MSERKQSVSCLLWPFAVVWRLVTGIIVLLGRLLSALVGLVFLIVGVALSLTIVGAILGVPLAVLGFLLLVRSIF